MKVDLFDFELPQKRIAQSPADPRDSARLLHVAETLQDRVIGDLPSLFGPGDLLVVNNTRVLPTRLLGKRILGAELGGKIEATLHKQVTTNRWWAFCRPAKKLKPRDQIQFDGLVATVVEKTGGDVLLEFDKAGDALILALKEGGAMPLPPYIKRADKTASDDSDYQTAFARVDGAVAAPTAGLHFTPALIEAIKASGAQFAEVTLHVGAGTFLPVSAEDTSGHKMHSEWWELSEATATAITKAERVVAVGTTSLRTLEASGGKAGSGETDIFITPGYEFQVVDRLLTNFHLPKSTLFMLVSAFSGLERMQAAYAHAIAQEYRFFSYGDACLLERA